MPNKEIISNWFTTLQDDICRQLEAADGTGQFVADVWQRPGGGGGASRVLTNGSLIEKGGVNFSAVWGKAPEAVLASLKVEPLGQHPEFFATGISIVLHPVNPYVPIIHMNTRYFEMSNGMWWFGGGIDLTPHYVDDNDARYFHAALKAVCDRHDAAYYPAFRKWADDYFYIRHRQETRGIGGIFFDYLKDDAGFSKASRFEFVKDVGSVFAPTYIHLAQQHRHRAFGEREKHWQHLRRGRYVEFNLVWDRGTKFGLDTDGRTESILMSLPPQAQWVYNHRPEDGSAEARTLALLKKDVDWLQGPPRG